MNQNKNNNKKALIIRLTLTAVTGLLVIRPENSASRNGGNVRLSCGTDTISKVQWLLRDLDKNNSVWTVYDGYSVAPMFKVRHSVSPTVDGRFDLVISTISNTDCGIYTCVESLTDGDNASALVTVISKCTEFPNDRFSLKFYDTKCRIQRRSTWMCMVL